MPSQARNSWSCDFCMREGFRSADEARIHEHECPESARKRPRLGSLDEQFPGTGMAPLSAAVAAEMGGEYESSRPSPARRITIMAPDDMHQHQLDIADVLACQNLEVFEAGKEYGDPRMGPIAPRQVGIRCVHCVQDPTDECHMYFPGSVENMAAGISMVADRHFARCPAASEQVREEYRRASEKRQRDRDEGRSITDEERNQMAMLTYCSMFCRNCGIVDKYPPQSGVAFAETERQLYAPIPHHAGGPNMPYPPMSGRNQPYPPMMSQTGDPMAPTPFSRNNRDPNDMHHSQGFDLGFSSAYGTPSTGGQSSYARNDMGVDGQMSQQRGPPQEPQFSRHVMSPYAATAAAPQEFPYFQDSSSTWSCRYCSGVPPQYRDQGSTWNGQNPPPTAFMNQHLQICRSFTPTSAPQGMQQDQPASGGYRFPAPPESSYGGPPSRQGQPGTGASVPFYSSTAPAGDSNYSFPPSNQSSNAPPLPPQPSASTPPTMALKQVAPAPAPTASDPGTSTGSTTQQAIDYLVAAEQDMYQTNPSFADEERLVLDEDRMLLTDYFFYLMKQLRVCRFTEKDRKTRGGKRENIAVGYGGLQCIHCVEQANARKFFWSNVDRLANSFAEIPSHVLKCRHTPNQTKTALLDLKARHAEQMAKLPRGSQKVFFRRMWRRLHESDPTPGDQSESNESTDKPVIEIPVPGVSASGSQPLDDRSSPSSQHLERGASSPGTSTDESALLFERSAEEGARALAASLMHSDPPSPSSRILLGIPEDKQWLSDMDCFIRRNLEVFCATAEDVNHAVEDRKYPIGVGQVGIRCIHCALAGGGAACRGNAVAYPYSISGVYEAVREFERLHLRSCVNVPPATKAKLGEVKGASSLSSVCRKYYVLAAKALGMYDTEDGIRSGGESLSVGSSAAFAFADGPSSVSEEIQKGSDHVLPAQFIQTGPATSPLESSRKRKQQSGEAFGSPSLDAKPPAVVKNEEPPSGSDA